MCGCVYNDPVAEIAASLPLGLVTVAKNAILHSPVKHNKRLSKDMHVPLSISVVSLPVFVMTI